MYFALYMYSMPVDLRFRRLRAQKVAVLVPTLRSISRETDFVGERLGAFVGLLVGLRVGLRVGALVGRSVGNSVGLDVGLAVTNMP